MAKVSLCAHSRVERDGWTKTDSDGRQRGRFFGKTGGLFLSEAEGMATVG